ncbi:hypothetical protein ACFL2V_06585 [Pseudomonadota bacterium]
MNVKLNFINETNATDNTRFVIFQKNIASGFDETVVAWRVIEHIGQGDFHPFEFPANVEMGASDAWGNHMPAMFAENGQLFHVVRDTSGDVLKLVGEGSAPNEVQLRNDLPQGAINANVYKNGKLLATKTGVAPGEKAVFEFHPTIWVGAVAEVVEGEVMNSAIIANIETRFSLQDVSSADIVATGGGSGPQAMPFTFSLKNIKNT